MIGRVSGWLGSGPWGARTAAVVVGLAGCLACASTASAASRDTYLSVFAGNGTFNYSSPGPATQSPLYEPHGVAVNPNNGDVYIADWDNYEVEQVTPDGTLSIFAGNGQQGAPVAGPATESPLGGPTGVAVDSSGDVFIADPSNNEIEEVTPGSPDTLSVVAGTGTAGGPTNGPATSSELNDPYGVAVDSAGDLYIADYENNEVEEVTPDAPGTLSPSNPGTLAVVAGVPDDPGGAAPTPGPATSSDLNSPAGVAVDSAGDLYIADSYNYDVEKVTPEGILSVVAGTGATGTPTPGPAASSSLGLPTGVAVDSAGDLYIADSNNNEVEEVTPAGVLSIFAGTGAAGLPTPGLASSSELNSPFGVAVNSDDLYIGDTSNQEVEQVGPWTPPANSTPPSISGTAQQGQTLTAINGTWSNSPTYSYQWERCAGSSCTDIATGSTYMLTGSDVGDTIKVVVTASNPGGSGSASAQTAVVQAVTTTTTTSTTPTTTTSTTKTTTTTPTTTAPGPAVTSCPAASGRLNGRRLGPVALGMTRSQARAALPTYTVIHQRFDRYCLAGGRGILAGYPSTGLLKTLSAQQRRQLRGRVVIALTANRRYSVDHITAGMRVARVRGRLTHALRLRIDGNTWYVLSGSHASGVLEVHDGKVVEVGIANRALAATHAAQRQLLSDL